MIHSLTNSFGIVGMAGKAHADCTLTQHRMFVPHHLALPSSPRCAVLESDNGRVAVGAVNPQRVNMALTDERPAQTQRAS
jgi:hypothetical protein